MADLWARERHNLTELGSRLRAAMTDDDTNLDDLAWKVGTDKPTLSRIRWGIACPSPGVGEALTRWLETRLQTPESDEEPSARCTDPDQSHATVRAITGDVSFLATCLVAARRMGRFDDGDLTAAVNDIVRPSGRRFERGTVARARSRLEQRGKVLRVGSFARPDRSTKTLHFTAPPERTDQT